MRFFVFNNEDSKSKQIAKIVREKLDSFSNFCFSEDNPEIVVTIGGDGCLLRSIHLLQDKLQSVAFIGISTGTLGFLCDYKMEELDDFFDSIKNMEPKFESNRLIELICNNEKKYFINEVRVESKFDSLKLEVLINEEKFETFKGNGVNISTSIGSTGYNRSLGGPIINSYYQLLIFKEISPINNAKYSSLNSSLILNETDIITLKGNFNNCIIGGDNEYQQINDEELKEVKIALSKKTVTFARYNKKNYYEKLRDSFIVRR